MILAAGPGATNAITQAVTPFPEDRIRYHIVGEDDGKGVCAREHHILAGEHLEQHAHDYDHLSIIAFGVAHLKVDGRERVVVGPETIIIRKGQTHELKAITPVTWYCIHPTCGGE